MFKKVRSYLKKYNRVMLILIAGMSTSFFQWLVICVMTKVFGTEEVGLYSGAAAIITPIMTFGNLSLRSMQVVDVESKYKIENVLLLKKITSVLTVICVIGCFQLNHYNSDAFIIGIFLLVSKIGSMFNDASYGYLIKENKIKNYTISAFVIYASSAVLFIFTALATQSFKLSMLAYAMPNIIVFSFYDLKNIGGYKKLFYATGTISDYRYMLKYCIPLALVQTINTLYDTVPKLFIEKSYGNSVLGIFSATSYISLAGGIVVTAITTAYATKLAQLLKQKKITAYFRIIVIEEALIAAFTVVVVAIFVLWGRPIVTFLYTKEFADYINVIIILIIGMSLNFMSRVLGTACTAAKLNNHQLFTATICVTFLCITSYIFIPQSGMLCAAKLICFTYAIKIILLLLLLMKNILFKYKGNIENIF